MKITSREYIEFLKHTDLDRDVNDIAGMLKGRQGQGPVFRHIRKHWTPPCLNVLMCVHIFMSKKKACACNRQIVSNLAAFAKFLGKPLHLSVSTEDRLLDMDGKWVSNTMGNKFMLEIRTT